MYKVMIIDDEPIIVEGLSRSVAWEKYDCQVVNTAHDGQEGIEKIRKDRPDMIFWISACRRWMVSVWWQH